MSTEEATGLQRLEGSVENIIFTNEENGYTICDMALADDEMVTVVGTMPLIGEGDHLSLYGKWVPGNHFFGSRDHIDKTGKHCSGSDRRIIE